MKRILIVLVAGIILLPIFGIAYLHVKFPRKIEPPAITATTDPEVVARGKYIANHVFLCMDCHSDRDWTRFTAPIVAGTLGKGGQGMEPLTGDVVASNITPFALGDWTDGEIARAIVSGIDHEGGAVSPSMPYLAFNVLYEEDVVALVSYLRSLDPVEFTPRESKPKFPLGLIFRTLPREWEPTPAPANPTVVERGEYIARNAGCHHCHTPFEKGMYDETMNFAGGHHLIFENTDQISPNITMDERTGIGTWTLETFVAKFRSHATEEGRSLVVPPEGPTSMPWTSFAGMTDEDLGAIWEFLKTVPVIEHDPEGAGM